MDHNSNKEKVNKTTGKAKKVSKFYTAQKMKYSIKDFFSRCDQIRSYAFLFFFYENHESSKYICSTFSNHIYPFQLRRYRYISPVEWQVIYTLSLSFWCINGGDITKRF